MLRYQRAGYLLKAVNSDFPSGNRIPVSTANPNPSKTAGTRQWTTSPCSTWTRDLCVTHAPSIVVSSLFCDDNSSNTKPVVVQSSLKIFLAEFFFCSIKLQQSFHPGPSLQLSCSCRPRGNESDCGESCHAMLYCSILRFFPPLAAGAGSADVRQGTATLRRRVPTQPAAKTPQGR